MKKSIILLCFVFCTILSLSAQTRIGVYTYGVLDENYNTLLGDNLVEAFTESNQYIAVNRSASLFHMLQKARSIQEKGHIDQSQILSTSKEYGETQICAVDVKEIDNMYIFRATLLDATTNEVLKTASAELAVSQLGYVKILEISQRLSARLITGSNTQQTSSNLNSLQTTSDVELARKRVEENRQYDISYAEFKNEWSKDKTYRTNKYLQKCEAAQHYMRVNEGLNLAGGTLLGVGVVGAGTAALCFGLPLEHVNSEAERKSKITAMLYTMGACVLPGIVLLSVAPACKRKAWKECRRPYDDAVKDLEKARKYQQRASLEFSPAIGYDWAGVSLKVKFN